MGSEEMCVLYRSRYDHLLLRMVVIPGQEFCKKDTVKDPKHLWHVCILHVTERREEITMSPLKLVQVRNRL